MPHRALVAATFAALAAGCASQAGPHRGEAAYRDLVNRGRAYAGDVCLSCHAPREGQVSPDPAAPPLERFANLYDAPYSLQAKLTEIAETGHYRMPPTQPHADEVEALAAYIGSLRRGAGQPGA
ncbi:MAG: cytochrome c [Caulobacteraceae bacterium]|nr:cytochrome c [Caulobacteraceae bacterium]